MTGQGNGQPSAYSVHMSAGTKSVVKTLHQQAIQAGIGREYLAAFRQIIARLSQDPLTFGEPLYRLPALRMLVRQAAVLPLVVDFAVHEDRRLVFIRGFKVLS